MIHLNIIITVNKGKETRLLSQIPPIKPRRRAQGLPASLWRYLIHTHKVPWGGRPESSCHDTRMRCQPFNVYDPIARDITRKRYPEIERERDKRATVVHNVACEGQEMTFLTICCTNINMWWNLSRVNVNIVSCVLNRRNVLREHGLHHTLVASRVRRRECVFEHFVQLTIFNLRRDILALK